MRNDAGQDATRAATYALVVLAFINLFNYLDRWVVAAVVESIKKSELRLSDTQLGFLGSGFIVVYALTSPIFGTLGDRRSRPPLIALGVAIWSLATALAGFARGFTSLFIARATVGVGEAAYGAIAPAVLADHFPIEKRGRVLALFFCAIPVGSACGYVLGGLVDHYLGWRAAFWIAGAPGLLLSLLVLKVVDPPRGQHDPPPSREQQERSARITAGPWYAAYVDLVKNRTYVLAVLGYAAYTFALGALAFWMPAFLERERGMPRSQATVMFGAIALVTGLIGTFAGGWLGDYFLKRTAQAYLWVSGIATLIAAPFTYLAVTAKTPALYLAGIILGELFIFVSTGPVNSAILNAVSPAERATAVGLSVLVMHGLGDIPSPPLVGILSDNSTLERAFVVVPAAVVVAGLIWMYAAWRGERKA